jgi:hypothetical protein
MVVALLFEQYGSAYRGLTRREVPASTREWYRLQETKHSTTLPEESSLSQQLGGIPATKQKRKRCKASKFLSSLAADLDVASDWWFFFHTCKLLACLLLWRKERCRWKQCEEAGAQEYARAHCCLCSFCFCLPLPQISMIENIGKIMLKIPKTANCRI